MGILFVAPASSNNEHANDRPKIDIGAIRIFLRLAVLRARTVPSPPRSLLSSLRVDKRGSVPVDNGSMALRMQAQDSALFEFVAFCLCLSSARNPPLLHPLPVTYRSAALSARLFGLWKPSSRIRNLQSPIRRPVHASFASFYCLSELSRTSIARDYCEHAFRRDLTRIKIKRSSF